MKGKAPNTGCQTEAGVSPSDDAWRPNASSAGSTPQPAQSYIVQSGDTCSSIAALFDVSAADLRLQNNLDAACSDLKVGQILEIPKK